MRLGKTDHRFSLQVSKILVPLLEALKLEMFAVALHDVEDLEADALLLNLGKRGGPHRGCADANVLLMFLVYPLSLLQQAGSCGCNFAACLQDPSSIENYNVVLYPRQSVTNCHPRQFDELLSQTLSAWESM